MEINLSNDLSFKVTVIGTGATGSHFASNLTQIYSNFNEEIESLLLIDGDKFEEKNLRNQKCLLSDINNNKAKTLGERYKRIYPNINVNYYDDYIKSSKQLLKILEERHFMGNLKYSNNKLIEVIIGTVDNDKTRTIIDKTVDYFKENDINYVYIDAGNGTEDMQGQCYINYYIDYKNTKDGANGQYLENKKLTEVYPDVLNSKDEKIEDLVGCAVEVNEHPQLLPTNLMAANLLIQLMYKIIIDKIIPENHLYVFDAKDISSTYIKI